MDCIIDFVRKRQLNFMLAALLIFIYVCFQFRGQEDKEGECDSNLGKESKCARATSRSRQRSQSNSRASSRRRRAPHASE